MEFSYLFSKDLEKKTKSLIRSIAYSGQLDLDKDQLRRIRDICKSSKDEVTVLVFNECLKHLRKDHSQVRVSTVKLIDYLFGKSHVIRSNLLDRFEIFIELTLAISFRNKVKLTIPPPKRFATLLKELTAKLIYRWHADFGEGYERLRFIFKHLKEHQLVDFSQFRVQTHEDRINQQRLIEKQERILNQSIQNRLKELKQLKPEIEQLIVQIQSLLDIVAPPEEDAVFNDRSGQDEIESFASVGDQITKNQHGIANVRDSIQVQFMPYLELERNENNKEIIESLREIKRELVEVKLIKLVAIEKTINKRSDEFINVLKQIIDLKAKSTSIVMKLSELKIIDLDEKCGQKHASTLNDYDSDSPDDQVDFEEVKEKEDLETYIPRSMRFEYGLEPIDPRELEKKNRVMLIEESFDTKDPVPGTSDTQRLSLSCNVRLESGKLCPRRDKVKCPFHGKIIPRDHNGVPLDENDRLEEGRRESSKTQNVPDWQDPELLRDIREAIGIDLTMPKKGKRCKKTSNLLDKKTCDMTPKKRLQKRLKKLVK